MSESSKSPTSTPELNNNFPQTSETPASPPPKLELGSNSGTPESPTSPPPKPHVLHNSSDLLSDIVLWRRKQLNVAILAAATATWVVMDVYQYSFITLLSWLSIALLACLFFWGTLHRFLKKEAPDLSELEISEETAREQAQLLKRRAEEGIRLMFHVSCEREWFVFAGAVASLYLTSLAAARLEFVTVCFIGIVGAMSVPFVCVKEEKKMRAVAENLRMRWGRVKVMMEEKLQKMKSKVAGKEKKTE